MAIKSIVASKIPSKVTKIPGINFKTAPKAKAGDAINKQMSKNIEIAGKKGNLGVGVGF